MKAKFLIIICFLNFHLLYSQSVFEVRHTVPSFGFDWPIAATKYLDTLGMVLYSAETSDSTVFVGQLVMSDSSFLAQINAGLAPSDSEYVPSNDTTTDILLIHKIMFENMFDSVNEIYFNRIELADTTVKCMELGISFFEGNDPEMILFAKIYCKENDIYTFLLMGLKRKETELTAQRNDFFNSIILN